MKNLIMISSTSHLNNMGDEFYSILKLVSGEEIFALVCVDESEDEPILILHNPIKMKPLHPQSNQLNYIKVTPWMNMTEEDMFVLRMDKVITMTECHDKKLISIYKQYIEEKDEDDLQVIKSRNKKGKINWPGDPKLGYISSVQKKRESLEKIFKSDSKEP